MTTNTTLIEKREELRRRLASGEYKTLVDVLLAGTDRLIRKITRRSEPLPIWYITVILILTLALSTFTAMYAGGFTTFLKIIESTRLEYGLGTLLTIWTMILTIVGGVMINGYISRIFILWRNDVLEATESVASLEEIEDWFERVCNRRLHLLAIIIGGLSSILFLVIPLSNKLGVFIGYWYTFMAIIIIMFVCSDVYQVFLIGLLSAKLRRFDLKLFAANPASSELISRLSGEFSFVINFIAVVAAIITLTLVLPGYLPPYGILLGLLYWPALIAIFFLTQTSLSSVIRRVKWKTLNEIQVRVEKLQASKNFANKEAINQLLDYHDRVRATRNSAIDLSAILGFINSLLLPLLAFLLGNLDAVLKLFARKP